MSSSILRLPAEWEAQAGILLAWPHTGTDWAERLAEVEATYIALVAAITRFETALVCVANTAVRTHAEKLLINAGVDLAHTRFIDIDYDDTWLRDSGPITLKQDATFRLNDYRFTGWGGKFAARRDDKLIAGLVARGVFAHAEHSRIDWALEGGAIESDGMGTILTTWRCLQQRHPIQSRAEMTKILSTSLAAKRVLWLEHGYLEGDDTNAHIDTLARFAPDGSILYQACDDSTDIHHAELAFMAAELTALRRTDGTPYPLHALPWVKPIFDGDRRLAASYANYLVVNGAVLVPAYDDIADTLAAKIIGDAHPGRHVIQVPCRALIWQNGSLHCVTMQLPQGLLA